MAGFESIVRPVVFPIIRPAAARQLPPEDDPGQGFATIGGTSGKLIDLPHTWTLSVSHQRPQRESRRQYDTERIYQVDQSGNINRRNYVDVERLRKVRMDGAKDGPVKYLYAEPPERENVETIETDMTRDTPA